MIESLEKTISFTEVRKRTEDILDSIHPEMFTLQPALFVSPPKWHAGHTSWFFEEFLLKPRGVQSFDESFGFLFNSYYEQVGPRLSRDNRGILFEPKMERVYDYRNFVTDQIEKLQADFSQSEREILEIGMHHEQQHQELLVMDTKYIMSRHPLYLSWGISDDIIPRPRNKKLRDFNIEKGVYQIGTNGEGFSFDNEGPRHEVLLQDALIFGEYVNNGDMLDFIKSGGYENPALWHSEGWDWVKKNQINAPLYWLSQEGSWKEYTLDGLKSVEPTRPLMHISYYEAFALARQLGRRIPTEFELEIFYRFAGKGELWAWSSSAYSPYPGYKIPEGAIGEYNGKFMVSQMTLKGGCSCTPEGHYRSSYRNFFYPYDRWQFCGIRLASDL